MRVMTIVGARPQFIKAAPVSRILKERHEEILVHSGQHYDDNKTGAIFRELGIAPNLYLGCTDGRGISDAIAALLAVDRPDCVLVYGDTTTTLAGALAATRAHIPLVHVEAGLRSFDWSMPEERNRYITDQIADLLLCPTDSAMRNLDAEGLTGTLVGDVMLDTARIFASEPSDIVERLGLDGYYLATVHRQATSDDPDALRSVVAALGRLGRVVWPVHPRTAKNLLAFGIPIPSNVTALPPLPYRDTVTLLKSARALLTDSGGMQKEAYFFGVPCVTLRDSTEWPETVDAGWNVLAGTSTERIMAATEAIERPADRPAHYGDGHAAEAVVRAIEGAL